MLSYSNFSILKSDNLLKEIVNKPEDFITNYSTKLKNELNSDFEESIEDLDYDEKEKVKITWLDFIERIDKFSAECIDQLNMKKVSLEKEILKLEIDLIDEKNNESWFDLFFVNKKLEKYKKKLSEIKFEINKRVFGNKTLFT